MKFNKWVAIAAVAMASTAAQASTNVFFDNFGTTSTSVLNTIPAGGWTVPTGTVDVVATGNQWGIACAGNSGRCLDLDGSTKTPGLLSLSFDTVANMTYNLTFDLSGNQRTANATDTVTVSFGSASNTFTVQGNALFSQYSLSFTAQTNGPAILSFLNDDGNDNIGAVLDNVSVTAVPEPETYALMLAGLGLMGTVVRRRQKRQA